MMEQMNGNVPVQEEGVSEAHAETRERELTTDEKVGIYTNGLANASRSIAEKAMVEERKNDRIAELREELGLPQETPALVVTPEGRLEEAQVPVNDIESLSDQEDSKFAEKLDILEQELRALPPEEKEAILNGGGGGRTSHEQYWEFKKSGKKDITFLKLLIGLLDKKETNLSKLALFEKYLSGMREEVKAELIYDKTHYYDTESGQKETVVNYQKS